MKPKSPLQRASGKRQPRVIITVGRVPLSEDQSLPSIVRRIRAVLDDLPLGTVLPTRDLVQHLNVAGATVANVARHPALARYRTMAGNRIRIAPRTVLWGSVATIEFAKKP